MATVPTATITARLRATTPARFTGSLLAVCAAIRTESAPCPAECCKHKSRNAEEEVLTPSAPRRSASSARSAEISIPRIVHPAALRICTISCPSRPSPMTATTSPSFASAVRIPCSATDPTVVNAASSKLTASVGMRAISSRGTQANSA